jgi:hypothetical protein
MDIFKCFVFWYLPAGDDFTGTKPPSATKLKRLETELSAIAHEEKATRDREELPVFFPYKDGHESIKRELSYVYIYMHIIQYHYVTHDKDSHYGMDDHK